MSNKNNKKLKDLLKYMPIIEVKEDGSMEQVTSENFDEKLDQAQRGNPLLMKKYFVAEKYDKADDLFKATYKIPAGKDFDKVIDELISYYYAQSADNNKARKDCLNALKNEKLNSKTGAEIIISQNTFECKKLQKEKIR